MGRTATIDLPTIRQLHNLSGADIRVYLAHRVYASERGVSRVSQDWLAGQLDHHPVTISRCESRLAGCGLLRVRPGRTAVEVVDVSESHSEVAKSLGPRWRPR